MSFPTVLTTYCVAYFIWAVILSDDLFHRLWSLSLCSLLVIIRIPSILPISTYTVPLYILGLLNFSLCIALSPLPVILQPVESTYEEFKRLEIVFPRSNDDGSRDALVADIVFVHDLASNPKTAWQARSLTRPSWVRDFLPQENLSSRIMTFNHNTRWESNALSKSLSDHGDDLVRTLRGVRKTDEEKSRPIIFIGHGFGGLIIKQAVVNAREQKADRNICEQARGFIFLGTPHKGSQLTAFGELISVLGYWRGSSANLLKNVKVGSEVNVRLHDSFMSWLAAGSGAQNTLCVFETVKEAVYGIPITHVVERESAIIDGAQKMGFEKGHWDMQRYASRDDPDYKDILDWIKERVGEERQTRLGAPAESMQEKTEEEKGTEMTAKELECLGSLFATDPAENKNALKRRKGERAAGTCEWILETDELKLWLGMQMQSDPCNSNILWLYGHPGTGKSTMAITLTEELPSQPYFSSGNKTLVYFFCDASSEKQRTAVAILRGLLYQLVKQHPQYMKFILPEYQKRKAELFTSFDPLWNILMEIGDDKASGEKFCIIDALDECERESQDILLAQISQTFRKRNRKNSLSSIHIMISSRPYPEINRYLGEFSCRDLASFQKVEDDLKVMISDRVKELSQRNRYSRKVTEELSEILQEKAEGTFLWVGIACGELVNVRSRDVVKTLKHLPRGLHCLYQQLLDFALQNAKQDQQTIIEILWIIAIARRQLSVAELAIACQLYLDEDEEDRLRFIQEDIELCRLMVVVQDGIVRLLNKSVMDFLTSRKERNLMSNLEAHATLANRCISHIIHNCSSSKNAKNQKFRDNFLEYAVIHWPEHAALAQSAFAVRCEHEVFFLGSESWREWLSEYSLLNRKYSALHVAAKWGITPLVYWALRNMNTIHSNAQTADTERGFNDSEFMISNGLTPLQEAARSGHAGVISILLDEAIPGWVIAKNVVKAAAGNRENGKEIIEMLLNRRNIRIQITEGVVKAAARNWENGKEIVEMLLDQRGDRIQIAEDVVEAAAGNNLNWKEIIEMLLNRQGTQIQITEDVVKAAAGNSWNGKEILKMLLDRRHHQIQITQDVIKAAASNEEQRHQIISLFIKRGTERVQSLVNKDILLSAASCGQEQVLILLRQHGGFELDNELLSIARLFNAAKAGNSVLVRKLLADDVPADTRNARGVTPLWVAATNGHEQVVRMLLQIGSVDVNAVSVAGRPPIFWAACQGHTSIVRLLLQANASPKVFDENGDTPYSLAKKNGHFAVAQLLEKG